MKIHRFALAAIALVALSLGAHAQYATSTTVVPAVKQPAFVPTQQWQDLGNGPLDIQGVEGNGSVYASGGTGAVSSTATGAYSTTVVLGAVPTVQPCVGCIITGVTNLGLTGWSATPITITAFNGITSITVSTALAVTNNTTLAWGAACPAVTAANVPGVAPGTITPLQLSAPLQVRGGVAGTFPLWTQSRLCAYGGQQGGFTFLYFPIGAH
jgi:hypothetical protein